MSDKSLTFDNGLKVMELEDRLETVQMGIDLPISARCDRKNCDCESIIAD